MRSNKLKSKNVEEDQEEYGLSTVHQIRATVAVEGSLALNSHMHLILITNE